MKETLRALREKNHFSQASVAEYLGISRLMYMKYETGENEPTVKTVKLLCQLYKVSYSDIIDNKLKDFKPSLLEISESASDYCAGIIHSINETPLASLYMRKFDFLSEEQKEIVGKLIDSLYSLNQKSNKTTSNSKKKLRTPGGLTGKFYMAKDFDETPEVFKEYM